MLIFFLSGVSALIYQVAWVRQATLVFGVSIYAYSAVLAAFMGGTALGSYWLGRRADVVRSPLRMFAWLQIGIALWGLAFPFALHGLMPLYGALARTLTLGSGLLTGLRLLLAILVLTPPTLLMGATLPAMARAYASRTRPIGSAVGQLYAAETLGAALGCGLTGLFLLRVLGTRETIFLAAALNIVAALSAWTLSRQKTQPRHPSTPGEQRSRGDGAPPRPAPPLAHWIPPFVIGSYALSGFAALGYEVAWARILAIFTLDAIFSFAIMLTTFLTGLTVGGWLGAWWVRRPRGVTVADYGNVQVGVGLSALLTLFICARLPAVNLEAIFGVYSITNVILYEFLLGFLTLILPTVLLGVLFPIVVSLYVGNQVDDVGARVGRLNAYNTGGAVLGSLFVGFILIPLIGLQASVATLAVINLIIGVLASWFPQAQVDGWRLIPRAGLVLGIAMIILLPPGIYLGFREDVPEQMVFYKEGVETTVAVFDVPAENFKVSFVNGRIEVPTDAISMRAFRLLGHLPALLKPDAQRALMLSFGNGIATGSLDTHQIPAIDAVDLSAEQFEAAELYWQENYNVLHSPRLHTYVEDGRNFLLQTPHRYDIITTDATHPVNTSSWALFTREFYLLVADRLTDDGVFIQWIPFHNLREADYKRILRTFQSVFPHTTLWYTGGSHTLLLATTQPATADWLRDQLSAVADNAIVQQDIGPVPSLLLLLAMDEESLRTYVGAGALSTDNNAYFLPHDEDNALIMQHVQEAVAQQRQR